MAAYTTSQEIKFGHKADQRNFGVVLNEQAATILLELKIKEGVYVKLKEYSICTGLNGYIYDLLFTRGSTLRFTVTGNLDWWIDESKLT